MDMDRENLNKWIDQWEKAQSKENFDDSKPHVPDHSNIDLFGVNNTPNNSVINECDTKYWKLIASNGDQFFKEGKDEAKSTMPVEDPDGKTAPEVTDELGGLANPVQARSRDRDSRSHITPNFTCGVELVELHKMKKQLEQLESKMSAADALAKSKEAAKVKKEIDSLWEKIDKLSNYLNPDFVRDYMS